MGITVLFFFYTSFFFWFRLRRAYLVWQSQSLKTPGGKTCASWKTKKTRQRILHQWIVFASKNIACHKKCCPIANISWNQNSLERRSLQAQSISRNLWHATDCLPVRLSGWLAWINRPSSLICPQLLASLSVHPYVHALSEVTILNI